MADPALPLQLAAPQHAQAQDVCAQYEAAGAFREDAELRAGLLAADAGDPRTAARHFRTLLGARPHDAAAHKNLAAMLMEDSSAAGHPEEATMHLREAVRLAPRWADAHFGLGVALQREGDHAGAMHRYQLALALDPEHASAHAAYLRISQAICDWAHIEGLWARSRHWLEGPYRELPYVLSPFSVVGMPSSPQEQREAARRWARTIGVRGSAPVRRTGVRDNRGAQGAGLHQRATRRAPNPERLRVGYLAADFKDDPVTQQVIAVLEGHDRSRVEVGGYLIGPHDRSALRQRSREACDWFTDLSACSAQQAAECIAFDEVDILIDLQGYTQGCRPEILALRPAPVQVSYLAYPATMGAPFIDHVLTDRSLTPPAQQQYWDERFCYLPDCYMPGDPGRPIAERPTRPECGLPPDGFVFCCMNHTSKITPAVFDVWMRLLHQVQGSVLWLFAFHPCAPHQLRNEAEARGIDAGRLIFSEVRPHAEYLARMQLADLFLDTWPYNAGATCNDALFAGLPVLTVAGQTYISRMASSQLRAAGLPDMVAKDARQYERWALELAGSRAALAGVRLRLADARTTGKAPLFDMGRYVSALEHAYARMVQSAAATG